ncbi:MAG TPA: TOMM precursor leader peptide-binding protein [Amycolatopsis sp.]|uniref:TOMM precursor leader peptide-binding protein n=1 Tax=Amycolatopsis sp. TaxID=37632 RepID=UPI002B4A693B|nr:TOMM precursor leader peptide-binding protein [Amycolatopsis sp.]HKS45715.1 TOMM precursor leader peptide-binding protein [Amycolatopsis sp.]
MTNAPTGERQVILPERPRLRPGLEVFDRAPGEVQIGLDPRHAMVASGLPPQVVTAMHRLDGSLRLADLLALATAEHGEQLRELLTELTRLGLVVETWASHSRVAGEVGLWSLRAGQRHRETFEQLTHTTVVLHGDGRLTIAIATLLAASGVGGIHVAASGVVTEQDTGSGYLDADIGKARRTAAAAALHRVNPATRTRKPSGDRQPELVVLADAIVPAPELVRLLTQEGVPHLPVRVRDGLGIVGPLVYPGRSSCLGCADLHRKALDPRWPTVAGQLAGRTQHADLGSIQVTAAMAANQILRALCFGDTPPPVWNTTIEIDAYEGTIEHRPWPPNPVCGCGALPGRP